MMKGADDHRALFYYLILKFPFFNRNIAMNMGVTKSQKFSAEQNRLANMAKVLGHPARIAILQELAKRNTCVCGEIVEVVGLAQATVSQHLKELKQAGLVRGTIEGTSVCYCLDAVKWESMKADFNAFLSQSFKGADCC